jgi:hypothetical protein
MLEVAAAAGEGQASPAGRVPAIAPKSGKSVANTVMNPA